MSENTRIKHKDPTDRLSDDEFGDYMGHGHDAAAGDHAWVLHEGKLETVRAANDMLGPADHSQLFPHINQSKMERQYRGRYAQEQNAVTVLKPDHLQQRELPGVLLKHLNERWPNARIVQFEAENNMIQFSGQYQSVFQSAPPVLQSLLHAEQLKAMTDGASSEEADRSALRQAGYAGWYEAGDGNWKQTPTDVRSKVVVRKVYPQPDGLFTAFDIPVFYANAVKSGHDGQPVTYDAGHVQEIIDNTNRSPQLPALTPYHVVPEQKLMGVRVPVLGRAFNFRADPQRDGWALCDFRDLKPETVDIWRKGQIASFSPGIVEDAGGSNRRFGHIAMLGSEAPALSSLPTTEIYACHDQVCFAATPMVTKPPLGSKTGRLLPRKKALRTSADKPAPTPKQFAANRPQRLKLRQGMVRERQSNERELDRRVSIADRQNDGPVDSEQFLHQMERERGEEVPLMGMHGSKRKFKRATKAELRGDATRAGGQFAAVPKRKSFRYRLRKSGSQQRFGADQSNFATRIIKEKMSEGEQPFRARMRVESAQHGRAGTPVWVHPRIANRSGEMIWASKDRRGDLGVYVDLDDLYGGKHNPAMHFSAEQHFSTGEYMNPTGQATADPATVQDDSGGSSYMEQLKAHAEMLMAAIAASEAGEPDAEAKLGEALGGIQECIDSQGGGDATGEDVDNDGVDDGLEGAGDLTDGADEIPPEDTGQFAPSMDKFHGYSAGGRRGQRSNYTNFTGDQRPMRNANNPGGTLTDDDVETAEVDDNSDPGQLFAANPQAAFAGLFEMVANNANQMKGLTDAVNKLLTHNSKASQSAAFTAARSEFETYLGSDEVKGRQFSSEGALATFDACKGNPDTVKALKALVLASPLKGTNPADMGQIFDASNATGSLGRSNGLGREVRMSEVLPGASDDPKLSDLANKIAGGMVGAAK